MLTFLEFIIEQEQLDELSKDTLKSYISKSVNDKEASDRISAKSDSMGMDKLAKTYDDKSKKRKAGINKAIDKLSEDYKHIDNNGLKNILLKNISDAKAGKIDTKSANKVAKDIGSEITSRVQSKMKSMNLNKDDVRKHISNSSKDNKTKVGMNKAIDKLSEQEQLDELSKDTLDRYDRKALGSYSQSNKILYNQTTGKPNNNSKDLEDKAVNTKRKRVAGIVLKAKKDLKKD